MMTNPSPPSLKITQMTCTSNILCREALDINEKYSEHIFSDFQLKMILTSGFLLRHTLLERSCHVHLCVSSI